VIWRMSWNCSDLAHGEVDNFMSSLALCCGSDPFELDLDPNGWKVPVPVLNDNSSFIRMIFVAFNILADDPDQQC
jgi:hypothetical protein